MDLEIQEPVACVQISHVGLDGMCTTLEWDIDPNQMDDLSSSVTELTGKLPISNLVDLSIVQTEAMSIIDKSLTLHPDEYNGP